VINIIISPSTAVGLSHYNQSSNYIFALKLKDFSKTFKDSKSCIFKEQFSTELCSMDSITAIFNIYFCDYGTVLVDKNKT